MRVPAFVAFVAWVGAGLWAAAPAGANGIVVESPDATVGSGAPRGVAPVVLVEHRVEATVVDRVARVEVDQTFRSRAKTVVEGIYLFPLPEGAAVHGFALTVGGRRVEGEVLAADDARSVYEGIVSRRRDPGLLEYAGRGLYRARVFPIAPGGEVAVHLSYAQVLPEDAGTLEFRYPLATDRLNGEPVERVSVEVLASGDADLKAVYSPTHAVKVARVGERSARATWRRRGAAMDRDFSLCLGRDPRAVGLSLLSHKAPGEDGWFLAVLAPRVDPAPGESLPKDVVFVLDRSGSMAGAKIAQARAAVTQGIGLLRPGDRFGVVAFATGVEAFREHLVPADTLARFAAGAWLDALPATGGTNLEGALRAALAMGQPDRLALVVLVTDGRPTVGARAPEEILKGVAEANAARARVFTFGVGSDLEVGLLDRLAESTGGVREYAADGDALELATGRLYAKVDRPALTDLAVDFGGGVRDAYPSRLPDLFAGGQVVVMGRYAQPGPRRIRLEGRLAGRTVAFEFEGNLRADEGLACLPLLWAQRKVAYLLDQIRLHGADRELVDEVVALATRYGIVTPYTAGLVVEDGDLEAARRVAGAPAPVPAPQGAEAGAGGPWRGPRSAPPGLREPSDPTLPAPPPATPLADPEPAGGTAAPPPPPTTPPPAPANPLPRRRKVREPQARPPPPPPPFWGPPAPPDESKDLRDRKDAASDEEAGRATAATRTAAGKTFVLDRAGRWVDAAWDPQAMPAPQRIVAWSDAWLALLARRDARARILALGDRVVFVWDGAAWEVVPAPGR